VIPELAGDDAGLEAAGGSSVVLPTERGVRVLTAEGEWRAEVARAAFTTARSGGDGRGAGAPAGFRDALVAGFVPGVALAWSWPDMLTHAVALILAAAPACRARCFDDGGGRCP
jgi:fructose-1-phosphate kinase PfkB-like protein